MAIIRPTGIDVETGQAREVEDGDDLFVSNIAGPADLNIDAGADITIDAGTGATLKLGNQDGIPQAITIGGGFDSPAVGTIWIEPTQGVADGQEVVIQGAFADDAQGFNGGSVSIIGGPSEAGSVIAGSVFVTGGDASTSASGLGGSVEITPGQGPDDTTDGSILMYGPRGGTWLISTYPQGSGGSSWLMGLDDPSTGALSIISGQDGDLGGDLAVRGGAGGSEGGHLFLIGGQGNTPADVYIRGGVSSQFVNGGGVWIDGADSTAEGGEGGIVRIGTNQGTEIAGDTRRVIIGDENTPSQEVLIYNFQSPTMSVGGTDNDIQPLMLLQPGYTTFGPNTGVVLTFGPVYYDPNTGETIRLGPNTVYIDNDGTNNFVRGEDGDEIYDTVLFTLPEGPQPYNLANQSIAPPSPIEPGTVTIRVILAADTAFSTVTDDGAGNFPSGAVLPSGGTINYTTGDLTGITASLETKSQVRALYERANADGEPLTPRGGNGVGTGNGGELRLRGGNGGITGDGADVIISSGNGGATSGNSGDINISVGSVTSGNAGSLSLASGVGTTPGNLSLRTAAQGSAAVVDRCLINAVSKALVNTTATSIFTAAVASNTMIGGSVNLTVRANDANDYQATTVFFTYAAVNDAGTVTSQVTLNGSNTATIASTGTLTVTASAVNGAGIITIQITATSSLTPTTLDATYQVINNAGQAITVV